MLASSSVEMPLGEKEHQVLRLIADDCTALEVADQMGISRNYVYTIIRYLKLRLGAKTPAGIVNEARKRGLLPPTDIDTGAQ